MRPHSFQPDPDAEDHRCEMCNETADASIHELDGVPLGDAEDDLPTSAFDDDTMHEV